jgi:fatty acid desaturase
MNHLSSVEIEQFGKELDELRDEVIADRGTRDAAYIRRVIAWQRGLEVGGRGLLFVSFLPPAWLAGTAALTTAKVLENMEIGHNVMHGQWDWMRDPKIHSSSWEWDNVSPASQWKHTHNFIHHTFTNVIGKDRDVGYAILRVSPEQEWRPFYLGQPLYNMLLAPLFEWGVALHDIEIEKLTAGEKTWAEAWPQLRNILGKAGRQAAKDYVAFPVLAGPNFLPVLLGNLTANVLRNVWAHTVIFCGHFPADIEVFPEERLENETKGEWYIRQLLGSGNISGGKLLHLMTGNLSHQIEHHLFPDLPSNRYQEIAPRVRELCEKYGLPYNTGSLVKQTATVWKKIFRLSLPGPAR